MLKSYHFIGKNHMAIEMTLNHRANLQNDDLKDSRTKNFKVQIACNAVFYGSSALNLVLNSNKYWSVDRTGAKCVPMSGEDIWAVACLGFPREEGSKNQ